MNDKTMTYSSYITNCHFFTEDDGCGHRDNRTLECHGDICPLLSSSRRYVNDNEKERIANERWNAVAKALSQLYTVHSMKTWDKQLVENAVERLMKAYDDWLD